MIDGVSTAAPAWTAADSLGWTVAMRHAWGGSVGCLQRDASPLVAPLMAIHDRHMSFVGGMLARATHRAENGGRRWLVVAVGRRVADHFAKGHSADEAMPLDGHSRPPEKLALAPILAGDGLQVSRVVEAPMRSTDAPSVGTLMPGAEHGSTHLSRAASGSPRAPSPDKIVDRVELEAKNSRVPLLPAGGDSLSMTAPSLRAIDMVAPAAKSESEPQHRPYAVTGGHTIPAIASVSLIPIQRVHADSAHSPAAQMGLETRRVALPSIHTPWPRLVPVVRTAGESAAAWPPRAMSPMPASIVQPFTAGSPPASVAWTPPAAQQPYALTVAGMLEPLPARATFMAACELGSSPTPALASRQSAGGLTAPQISQRVPLLPATPAAFAQTFTAGSASDSAAWTPPGAPQPNTVTVAGMPEPLLARAAVMVTPAPALRLSPAADGTIKGPGESVLEVISPVVASHREQPEELESATSEHTRVATFASRSTFSTPLRLLHPSLAPGARSAAAPDAPCENSVARTPEGVLVTSASYARATEQPPTAVRVARSPAGDAVQAQSRLESSALGVGSNGAVSTGLNKFSEGELREEEDDLSMPVDRDAAALPAIRASSARAMAMRRPESEPSFSLATPMSRVGVARRRSDQRPPLISPSRSPVRPPISTAAAAFAAREQAVDRAVAMTIPKASANVDAQNALVGGTKRLLVEPTSAAVCLAGMMSQPMLRPAVATAHGGQAVMLRTSARSEMTPLSHVMTPEAPSMPAALRRSLESVDRTTDTLSPLPMESELHGIVPAPHEPPPGLMESPGSSGVSPLARRDAAPDLDEVVERAVQALMLRLEIEGERRGFAKWV